ncbi:MAG: hypothetical protein AB8H47_27345 [Bacteroidia bacterium]
MRYWLSILILLCVWACQDDAPSGERPVAFLVPDANGIQRDFSVRLGDTNQHALDESILLAGLPAVFAPYQERRTEQTSFSGRTLFSQSSAIYHMEEGQFLAIKLSDYARDSSAFLHLFEQFSQIETTALPNIEGRKIRLPLGKTFGWAWKDRQTGIQYLAAGVQNRFHVQLQTNRLSGIVALEDAFRRIDWQKLQREAEKK